MNVKLNQNIRIQKIENKVCDFIWDEVHKVIVLSYSKNSFQCDNIKSSNTIPVEMHEIEIPIIIEKNLATCEYRSGILW